MKENILDFAIDKEILKGSGLTKFVKIPQMRQRFLSDVLRVYYMLYRYLSSYLLCKCINMKKEFEIRVNLWILCE